MLEASMMILLIDLILSVTAVTTALVFCACLDSWDEDASKRGKAGLCLGFAAVTVCLLTVIFFHMMNVQEYLNLTAPCLTIAIVIFCSYIILSIVMVRHKYNNYMLDLLNQNAESTE